MQEEPWHGPLHPTVGTVAGTSLLRGGGERLDLQEPDSRAPMTQLPTNGQLLRNSVSNYITTYLTYFRTWCVRSTDYMVRTWLAQGRWRRIVELQASLGKALPLRVSPMSSRGVGEWPPISLAQGV